jgi:hypothetical protein
MGEPKVYNFEQQPEIDLIHYLINLADDIPEPEPVLKIGDTTVFTRGNISCISGKAKSRKSFLTVLLSAVLLESNNDGKLLIFDTEMSKFHVAKTAKRIHRLLEWDEKINNGRLRVYSLRELKAEQRKSIVLSETEKYKPVLIFIDGIRDLANDFNSVQESGELVGALMQLSSKMNIHICCVLHENKASDTLRGHLGTEIVNKSETVITVKTDGNVSSVSPAYCRNIPFDEFHFRINDSGLPEICEKELQPSKKDKLKELFSEALPFSVTLGYADLMNRLTDKTGKVKRTAERYIKEATEAGIIIKNKIGMYYFFESNLPTNIEEDGSLPF